MSERMTAEELAKEFAEIAWQTGSHIKYMNEVPHKLAARIESDRRETECLCAERAWEYHGCTATSRAILSTLIDIGMIYLSEMILR